MITDTYIKVNVSGRIFEIKSDLLAKIPYIRNIVEGCGVDRKGTISEELRLDRSALVFEHVLSYIQDPFYPYPAKYSYELDFLDVVYDKENLYHSNPKIKELNTKIELLSKEINIVKRGLTDCGRAVKYEGFKCGKSGCSNTSRVNNFLCKACYPLCAEKYCQSNADTLNYCSVHQSLKLFCHKKGCWRSRLVDSSMCFYHQ